jgi:hypothetical protein
VCQDCENQAKQKKGKTRRKVCNRRRPSKKQAKQQDFEESEQLIKLKQERDTLLENADQLPEEELKRLKQIVRNRISA